MTGMLGLTSYPAACRTRQETRTCMLTTVGKDGLHSRPMATAGIDFDTHSGEFIYFVTEKTCTKVGEIIERDNQWRQLQPRLHWRLGQLTDSHCLVQSAFAVGRHRLGQH